MLHKIWKSAIVLALLTNSVWAMCPPLTDQQVQEYQQILDSGYSAKNIIDISNKIYHMPREEWPENARALLMTLTNQLIKVRKVLLLGEGYILWQGPVPELRDFNGLASNLIELAAYQKDARYVPFIARYLGSGLLAVDAMQAIGEPAFEATLEKLNKKHDGWSIQTGALKVFKIWLEKQTPFLQSGPNRQLLKQRLLRVAQESHDADKGNAIGVLKYINEPDVITRLTAISRNELLANNVRASARASLEFLNNR